MVGIFINTLPLRLAVDPERPLIPWLQEVRARWAELRPYEHTPLNKVQAWSSVTAGSPLFESIVVFENFLLNTRLRALGGAWRNRAFTYHGQTNFPISVMGYLDDELLLLLGYDRQRFADDTVTQDARPFALAPAGVCSNPTARLRDLSMLTGAERAQLLDESAATAVLPARTCIHDLVEEQARRRPEAVAVVCGGSG